MLSLQDIDAIVLDGGVILDPHGDKIGSVEQIFTSGETGYPAFVTVRTGLFGMSESFVPLDGASLRGSVVTAAFTKETVKNGPRIDSNRGAITDAQALELYQYFGIEPIQAGSEQRSKATGGGVTDAANRSQASPAAGDTAADPSVGTEPRHPAVGPPPPPPHLHQHVPLPPPHPGFRPGGPHPGQHREPLAGEPPAGPHPEPPHGRRRPPTTSTR